MLRRQVKCFVDFQRNLKCLQRGVVQPAASYSHATYSHATHSHAIHYLSQRTLHTTNIKPAACLPFIRSNENYNPTVVPSSYSHAMHSSYRHTSHYSPQRTLVSSYRHAMHYLPQRTLHTTNINHAEFKFNLHLNTTKFFKVFVLKKLVKFYFDPNFNESEFLEGAQQAICYVSTQCAEGKVDELDELLTPTGVESIRTLYESYENKRELLVNPEVIGVGIHIADIDIEYAEGRKYVRMLVHAYPHALKLLKEFEQSLREWEDELKQNLKEGGGNDSKIQRLDDSMNKNFGVIQGKTRLVISFRRDYTPDVAESSDWLIEYMEYNFFRMKI